MKQIDTKKLRAIMQKKDLSATQLGDAAGVGHSSIYQILKNGYCRETTAIQLANALKTSSFIIGDMPSRPFGACGNRVVNINTSALSAAWKARKMSNAEFKDSCGIDYTSIGSIIGRGTSFLWTAKAIAKGLGIPLESFVLDGVPEQIEITEAIDEPDEVAAEPEAVQTEEPSKMGASPKAELFGRKVWMRISTRLEQDFAERCGMSYERMHDILFGVFEPTLSEIVTIAEAADLSLDELLKGV